MIFHGGLLALTLLSFEKTQKISPLPIGVELAYVDQSTSSSLVASPKSSKRSVPVDVSKPEKTSISQVEEVKKQSSAQDLEHGLETLREGQGHQAGQREGQEGVENGSKVSAEERYLFELKKLLERKKIYPSMAKSMGQEGTVLVKFTLDRDGKVKSLEFEKESHRLLNDATARLIRSIEGLKPFPPEIAKSTWTLSVPVEYSLR